MKSVVVDQTKVDGILVREVRHDSCAMLDDHTHDGATIGILLSGEVKERRGDGTLYTQRAGELFARRSSVVHANQYVRPGSSLFIELERDDVRTAQISRTDALVRNELADAVANVVRSFRSARREGLKAAIDLLLRRAGDLRAPVVPAWLEAAREILSTELMAPPPLGALARRLGVHPVHFSQAFTKRYRQTPRDFLRGHRVFQAVALAQKGEPLAGVAATCGFADQSHMTRQIRATWGAPPGRLVKRRAEANVT